MQKSPKFLIIVGSFLFTMGLTYGLISLWGYETSIRSVDAPLAVLAVLDGDTIVVDLNGNGVRDGREEEVQLLGVDAEEMTPPASDTAIAAQRFVQSQIGDRLVRLAYAAKKTDLYDRTLAFVYLGDELLNKQIVEAGYAKFYHRYAAELPGEKAELLLAAEQAARSAHRGPVWQATTASRPQPLAGGKRMGPFPVLRVIDGDSLAVDLNGNGRVDGKVEEIRLLGVDAPEMIGANAAAGARAKAFVESLVAGRSVFLTAGPRLDRYGRTLAFAYLGDELLNERIIREGYATFYRRFANELPAEMRTTLEAADAAARAKNQ